MASIWNDFGFRESPYATEPVPATEEGEMLLVGRSAELDLLKTYLTSSATHPTIEGDNGVGKTSLVSVAGYQLRTAFELEETNQLLVPLAQKFQLAATDTAQEFRHMVLLEVGRAFIEIHDLLRRRGFEAPDVGDIDRWLNDPLFKGKSLSASGGFAGGGFASTTSPSTSAGFSEIGYDAAVTNWLRTAFPSRHAGGFICVIDNLELLETSAAARGLLEAIRDTVLNVPGLRWVLCGARGIVRTAASSPRLEGVLAAPLEIRPVADEHVAEVVAKRIEVFGMGDDPYAPVEPEGFRHIYDVLHANLRNALKLCEDFSFWIRAQGEPPEAAEDKFGLLEVWLAQTAEEYLKDTKSVTPRAWRVFDDLIDKFDGSCSPSDYEAFDFKSMATFRAPVRMLEQANLVQSARDDTDERRKTISATPRGWLVRYQRSGYKV